MISPGKILALCLIGASLTALSTARADVVPAGQQQQLTGMWMTTDYPIITHAIGDTIAIGLHLENRGLPPQELTFDVRALPKGWHWEFSGSGSTIGGAMVRPDQTVEVKLDLTPPADAKPGTYAFTVSGASGNQTYSLPISLTLSAAAAAKVTLEPKLPALRGTPKSTFDFQITTKNESKEDQVYNLLAQTPPGFQAVFKELYGSNELTSIPIKAGESKDIKVTVTPPEGTAAGKYPVQVAVAGPKANATTDLLLDITGQPALALTGADGRLSGNATAGKERTFNFSVANNGTAPAKAVKFSSSPPPEWKITFAPDSLPELKPGDKADVAVNMTPSDKAIAGDYVVSIRANGDGASDSVNFRVTVLTSTMWGIAGLGIIGVALLVFAGAVTRYGRR
jgi:uncharacterized repeat protein (TIGR01451 family)